jgi:hypothetical protein
MEYRVTILLNGKTTIAEPVLKYRLTNFITRYTLYVV